MPTPTYTPIAEITLSSSATSITFSSIPATYRDLVLVQNSRNTSSANNTTLRFNGDSGANYNMVFANGTGSAATSAAYSNQTLSLLSDVPWDISTTVSNLNIVQIMDYATTNKHKSFLARTGVSSSSVIMTAQRWASTSAITSIQVGLLTAATFTAGSTFTLYGIAA